MNDRLFPTRPILAVSAAVFRDGRALIIRRARAPLLGHFSLPGGGVEVGRRLPPRSLANLWKRSESKPKSLPLTGMWRRFSTKGASTNAFRHCFVCRALDERRAAAERRGRRHRMDRPRRPPALADNAGTGGGSWPRGADHNGAPVRRAIPRLAAQELRVSFVDGRFHGHDRRRLARSSRDAPPRISR